jgi:cell division protein FtsQ
MSDYVARRSGPNALVQRRRDGKLRGKDRALREPERPIPAILIVAASLVLVALSVLVIPPSLRVTRYEISGNADMSREDVLSVALIHDPEYFFSLDVARIKTTLTADPRIASVSVEKLFPNRLKIEVKERKAVAAALVPLNGRSIVACIDSDGAVFAEAGPDTAVSVPVLSGIRFENFRLGTRLPPALSELLASLGEIQAREPALLAAVSEIRVVPTGPPANAANAIAATSIATTELLIYPLNQRIPVRVGASIDAPTLRSIILVLDVLGTRGIAGSVQEIDFRAGTVVYRSKEGQSG